MRRKSDGLPSVVTAGLIVFCNVLLLFGVWVSGVNLDELVKTPDLFDAKEDVCLRLSWERVKARQIRCGCVPNGSNWLIHPVNRIS